jgi:hypothetical protein
VYVYAKKMKHNRRNVFIRNEDLYVWDRILRRPEWLHDCIQEYKKRHPELGISDIQPVKSADKKLLPSLIAGIDESE